MKSATALIAFVVVACSALAQTVTTSATVPITLDHNRIIVDVYFPVPDGGKTRVRGWVDNGNADLWISGRLAKKLALQPVGSPAETSPEKPRKVQPPRELQIGTMTVQLSGLKEATAVPGTVIGGGTSAEINLPSTVLRNYDVVVDYPNREFTIGAPGTIHFQGSPVKPNINGQNGLIQIPGKIEGETHNLALDLGATVSFISSDLLPKWQRAHPKWPHMTGAVGPANMWGMKDEASWEMLRVPQIQYGGLTLKDVVVAPFPVKELDWFEKRAGVATIGLIGADALLKYRVGLDYGHSAVYFEQLSKMPPINMDVVGLILHPEPDERYTLLGVADYEGKPSVPEVRVGDILVSVDGGRAKGATMGQVWSLLEGSPGTVRTLVLEREGKQFTVNAPVCRFLAPEAKKASSKAHARQR
ncbi:MAG TPA: hypothetical protein VJX16_26045 [Terriglobales bacterium]|nr:hypothetical protein [Terriglobales bacterium]